MDLRKSKRKGFMRRFKRGQAHLRLRRIMQRRRPIINFITHSIGGALKWRSQLMFMDERAWYSVMTKSIPKKRLKRRRILLR